ncbi:MAG: hypothetical protein IPK76_18975 [Lewinellaceae bacterium]|nr:hypothetical protein [Lewinellaceae bacterium]
MNFGSTPGAFGFLVLQQGDFARQDADGKLSGSLTTALGKCAVHPGAIWRVGKKTAAGR